MKIILRLLTIILIKYLQKKYKHLSIKNKYRQSNSNINKLILIQSVLYYLKGEFRAYGYFHRDCTWSKDDEKYFSKIFPQKDNFEELDIVVWYNPEAVPYYHNKIFDLGRRISVDYSKEIKQQLIKWKEWN